MSDAIGPAANIPPAGAARRREAMPGVAVAVMRKVLDLMLIQGHAAVSMINSAAVPAAQGPVQAPASTPVPQPVTDPLTAQQVDFFA